MYIWVVTPLTRPTTTPKPECHEPNKTVCGLCLEPKRFCDGLCDCKDGCADEQNCGTSNLIWQTTIRWASRMRHFLLANCTLKCTGSNVCLTPEQICDKKCDCKETCSDEKDCILRKRCCLSMPSDLFLLWNSYTTTLLTIRLRSVK